jgi:hypothetical protein
LKFMRMLEQGPIMVAKMMPQTYVVTYHM